MSDTKQVIVMRKDLNMRKGKMIAQGAHASMAFLTKYGVQREGMEISVALTHEEVEWIENSFAKICLGVESEEQLMAVAEAADCAGLTVNVITDSGRTEFGGVPTVTCLAIGPHEVSKIDAITGREGSHPLELL